MTEDHCAARCAIVAEAVKTATLESRLSTAIVALDSGMSIRAAAEKFGVSTMTLQRKFQKRDSLPSAAEITTVPTGTVVITQATVEGKDGRVYRRHYSPSVISRAIELKDEGKTIAAIAREIDAPYMTVSRWLKKPRPEPVAPSDPPPLTLEPPKAEPKPKRPQVPSNLKQAHRKERQWINERWIPIAQNLAEAHRLLRLEHHRLQSEFAGPQGSLLMVNRWEAIAKLWAESGDLAGLTAATGNPDAVTFAGLLSELERSARVSGQLIGSIEGWTGCKPDPTRYQPTPTHPHP